MSRIVSFRGLIADADVERINLHTIDGKTGYLVSNGNIDELYIAIKNLVVSRSLREEFGAAARQRVTENFSINTMVAQYVDAIETAVASSACKKP